MTLQGPPESRFYITFIHLCINSFIKYLLGISWNSLVVQCVKDPTLSLQQFRLQLWYRFDPWSGNTMCCKKKKKKEVFIKHLSHAKTMLGSEGTTISKNRHLHLCGICYLMIKTDMNKIIIMNMCKIVKLHLS